MSKVRVAVVGCGVMGSNHAKAAVDNEIVELAAVVDVQKEAAERIGKEYNAEKVLTDYNDVLTDDSIDVIILALPANLRAQMSVDALKAGKHLLTEKPVARNVAEVQAMLDVQGDLVAACCSSRYRHFESATKAAEIVASGKLGKLRIIRFRGIRGDVGQRGSLPAWRVSHELNGGGIHVNWGCYDLDYVLGIAGWNAKPVSCFAKCWSIAPHLPQRVAEGSDAEEHAIALVNCEDDLVISMERAEAASLATEQVWQIIGEKASLRLDMLGTDKVRKIYLDETDPDGPLKTTCIFDGEEDRSAVFHGPLQCLVDAIQGKGEPKTSLKQAMLMQKMTDALYESSRTGQLVAID